jgi:hypothetical protein
MKTRKQETKTRKQTPRQAHRYDKEMIRDFLTQLLGELRESQMEYTNPGTSSPEPDEQVKRLVKKYRTKLVYGLSFQDVTDDQQSEIDRTLASVRQRQIDALDFLLKTAFQEALAAVGDGKRRGADKAVKLSVEDWFRWTKNGSSGHQGEPSAQHGTKTNGSN